MNQIRVVVATYGRVFRNYVGRLPGGRRLPGGPRPVEQIWAFCIILAAAVLACMVSRHNAVSIFGIAAAVLVITMVALSRIKYDGVPLVHKLSRIAALLFDRRPVVVAPEELDRQCAANPHAFLTPVELTEAGAEELQ